MSAKISETISQFIIPNELSPEIIIKFKALSKEAIQQMKMVTLEDEQKYHNICTSLKQMANPKAASTIAKWERVASAIKTVVNLLASSNKGMIEQFDRLSGTIIEHMPYVPAALFSDFRSACSRLKDCPDLPAGTFQKIEKWSRLLSKSEDERREDPPAKRICRREAAPPAIKILLDDTSFTIPPASFKQGTYLNRLLSKSISDFNVPSDGTFRMTADNSDPVDVKAALQDPSQVELTEENVWEILRIANRYDVQKLKKRAIEFAKTLPIENAILILQHGHEFCLDELYNHGLSLLGSLDKESLEPFLLKLFQIAKQRKDSKLAKILFGEFDKKSLKPHLEDILEITKQRNDGEVAKNFFHLLTDDQTPISLNLSHWVLEFASMITRFTDEEIKKWDFIIRQGSLLFLSFDSLIEIDIKETDQLTPEALQALLIKCPSLQKMHLDFEARGETAFGSKIIKLDQLVDLKLRMYSSGKDGFSNDIQDLLKKCPNLQKLNLEVRDLTDAAFASEEIQLDQLTSLTLKFCHNLSDDGLKALLKKCPNLQKFHFIEAPYQELSGHFFIEEVKLTELRDLALGECRKLKNNSLKGLLVNCPKLQSLSLWENDHVTGAAFEGESIKFENLTKLLLEIDYQWPNADAAVEMLLNKCPKLQNLQLSMDTEGAVFSSPTLLLKELQRLKLRLWEKLDGNHLKHLPERCPHLQKLSFTDSVLINEAELLNSTQFAHLTELSIDRLEGLSEEGFVEFLKKCPHLLDWKR